MPSPPTDLPVSGASDPVAAALGACPLFAGLDPAVLAELAGRCQPVSMPGGATLLGEGEAADAAWLLVSGRLRAWAADPEGGPPRLLGEAGAGEVVGELALLADEPRSASVGVVRDSELVRIPSAAFMQSVARDPDALLAVTRALVRRLRRNERQRRASARPVTLAVVPITECPGLDGLVSQLASALGGAGEVRALRATEARRAAGEAEEGPPAAWLDAQERGLAHLLLVGEAGPTAWTRRCLRQADRVVLVHERGQPPLPALDADLARLGAAAVAPGIEVVALREPGTAPLGSAAIAARAPTARPLHARRGDPADASRLARLLVGRGTGLVLSGGGARGFAHIGVLRALERAGLPIDSLGGTSIGGMLAALAAAGHTADEVERIVRDAFFRQGSPIDWTVPVVSLAAGQRVVERLRALFGDGDIEDLALPFFCVSSNLTRAAVAVHTRGPVWRALRASASLPAILPPMRIGDDLHADGGLVNAMPVDVMRERIGDAGRVIAVDAMFESTLDAAPFDGSGVFHGGRHLLDGLLGRRARPAPPNTISLLLECYAMGETHYTNARRQHADVILRPAVGHIGIVAWEQIEVAIEAGYRATMERLETTGGGLW